MQIERRISSLLEYYAEMTLILSKDNLLVSAQPWSLPNGSVSQFRQLIPTQATEKKNFI